MLIPSHLPFPRCGRKGGRGEGVRRREEMFITPLHLAPGAYGLVREGGGVAMALAIWYWDLCELDVGRGRRQTIL